MDLRIVSHTLAWHPAINPSKWKRKLLSCVQLFVNPWTIPSMESSRQNTGVEIPSPGDLPSPGIEPSSPALQADSLPAEPPGKPKNTGVGSLSLLKRIFLTQESNRGLLHCRQILYQLSYQGNGTLLQYSCLENPMDRGAWGSTVHGVARVRHDWATKSPPHCFLLIISTLQMRKLRLRLNNFPKSQQVRVTEHSVWFPKVELYPLFHPNRKMGRGANENSFFKYWLICF